MTPLEIDLLLDVAVIGALVIVIVFFLLYPSPRDQS